MTTFTLPPSVTVPDSPDALADALNDSAWCKDVLASKDVLAAVMNEYAKKLQGEGTEINSAVADALAKGFEQWAEQAEVVASADDIKRLNLDPQSRPAGMLTSHRQATAYNAAAVGAALDKDFSSAAEYFKAAWHLNPSAETRGKMEALRNAYSTVVPAEGGFLVPEILRAQLLEIALEMAVVRPRATVVPMAQPRLPFPMIDSTTNVGSVYGGMIGFWGEESAALVESNPKFGQIVLDAKKLTGFAVVPNELLADSIISFAALIERLWPTALAFFEDLAFMSGTGVGEPLGFLGAGNPAVAVQAAEAGQAADTIVWENVVKMYSRMLPSSLGSAVWVVSPEAVPEVYTMALSVGTGGGPIVIQDGKVAPTQGLLGRPIVVSEKAGRLGDRGDIALADLSYYLVGDRQVMSAASSTEYKFGNDQTCYRLIQRVDGQPWIKSPITPANGGPTLSPFVELAAR